jgi:hypothetical protein
MLMPSAGERTNNQPPTSPGVVPSTPLSADDLGLPEEQHRGEIGTALHNDEFDRAIQLLAAMAHGPERLEECDRVFNALVKRAMLVQARKVVDICWDGDRRRRALEDIAVVALKIRNGGEP